MEVRFLGTRQGESRQGHFVTILVDGVLAIDAGSLASALKLKEQAMVESVLLTHQHFDHTRDLAAFGFNRLGRGQVRICSSTEVRAALEATILNESIWLNFFKLPTLEAPTFIHEPVEADHEFHGSGYTVRPITSSHPVPTLGYAVTSDSGGTLLYTGDTGPGCGRNLAKIPTDLLIIECTFGNADSALAKAYGHLSPELLAEELKAYQEENGLLPKVAVIHVNPYYEKKVAEEIAEVARALGADLWLPEEGERVVVVET